MFAEELLETTDESPGWSESAEVDPDWSAAACRSATRAGLTALFFSEQISEINAAKAICAGCPLLEPCLRAAVVRREPAGVWGGQLFVNGHILSQKRKRGRPPKATAPEPELVLPPRVARLLAERDGQARIA